jgi:hypothetical protein
MKLRNNYKAYVGKCSSRRWEESEFDAGRWQRMQTKSEQAKEAEE